MLVNILILVIAAVFSSYVIGSACRKYIGLNPQAPSLRARIKAWWPGFVKRNIVDDDPYQDESHAGTRYADDYVDWLRVPDGYDWVAVQPSGSVFKFPEEPNHTEDPDDPDWWYNPSHTVIANHVDVDAIVGLLPPWRDSLRQRPVK